MKNAIFLLIFNLLCLLGFSQSNIRLNNYWENTYYINPASMYSEYQYVFTSAARTQWIGFPGAPKTVFMTATYRPTPKRQVQVGQFGIKASFDMIGFTELTTVSLSYSYSVKLKKNLLMNLGTSGSIQNVFYDMTKSNLQTIGDPAIYTKTNEWNFSPDVGVEFVGKSFLIGAVGQNLFSLFTKEDKLLTNSNFLYALFRKKSRNPIDVQYGICAIQNEELSQIEFNLTSFLNTNNYHDLFQLGLSYRTRKEFGVSMGVELGKFGKNSENSCRLAMRYDYDFSGIRYSSSGTPEILLIFKFGIIPDCKCQDLFK